MICPSPYLYPSLRASSNKAQVIEQCGHKPESVSVRAKSAHHTGVARDADQAVSSILEGSAPILKVRDQARVERCQRLLSRCAVGCISFAESSRTPHVSGVSRYRQHDSYVRVSS